MSRRIIFNMRSSMSAKIALIITVPVVLVSSFFSYHHYAFERRMIFRDAETRLLTIGEDLKGPAETFLDRRDFPGLQNAVERAGLEPDIALISVFNRRGIVINCTKKQRIGSRLPDMHPEEMTVRDIAAVKKALDGGYSSYYDPGDVQSCLVMPLLYGEEGVSALFVSFDIKATKRAISRRAVDNVLIAVVLSGVIGFSIYFLFHALFTRRLKTVSSAAVSLAKGDMSVRAKADGTDEIAYLATSFNLLADEITNWRGNLEEMAASRLKDLMVLYEVANTVSRSLDLGEVLPKVLDRVLENTGEDRGAVVLLDSEGRKLMLMAHRGLSGEGMRQIAEHGQGCTGDVILQNSSLRVSGETDADEGAAFVPGLEQDRIRSALVVPIAVRGIALGAFAAYSEKGGRFTDQDEAKLASIGNQIGVAVENARLYEKTLELARMDGLTNVATRRYLVERLRQEIERTRRYHTSLSVVILDLDKFKDFNDAYGHLNGDELLKTFSSTMRHNVRSSDVVGRYGGEEFCIVLPNTSLNGARVIAERIRKATEKITIPVGEGRPPAGRTVSIGIAEFSEGQSMEDLLTFADAALYRAKEGGRNRTES